MEIDDIDRRIVERLVEDGRISFRALGHEVGLSASATADRVHSLVRRGVISRFTVVVNDAAVRREVEAVVDVRLASEDLRARFEERLAALDTVLEALHLTGHWDYQLRLACTSTAQVDETIRDLKRRGGVRDTQTRIVLNRLLPGPA